MDEETEKWLKGRPESIRDAFKRKPPHLLYRMETTGHIVFIMSYIEPDGGPWLCEHCKAQKEPQHLHQGDPDNATVSVGVAARFNPGLILERRVFGIKLDDLVPLKPDEQALIDQALKAAEN